MKSICKSLGVLIIVFGVLGSIVMAMVSGITAVEYRYGVELERSWLLTILYFLLGLFITFTFAVIFFSVSEILERLETMGAGNISDEIQSEESTIQNENGESTMQNDLLSKLTASQPIENTFWKCPRCGKSNPLNSETCSCGEPKY